MAYAKENTGFKPHIIRNCYKGVGLRERGSVPVQFDLISINLLSNVKKYF